MASSATKRVRVLHGRGALHTVLVRKELLIGIEFATMQLDLAPPGVSAIAEINIPNVSKKELSLVGAMFSMRFALLCAKKWVGAHARQFDLK